MLPSEHITLFVYITQTQTSKASMIAKLCPCHQNVGSPRLVIWATEHLSLLLWLPSGTLLQESRSHPSPKSLRLQMEKKIWYNPRSSSSTREAWETESTRLRDAPNHHGLPPSCWSIFIPLSLWSLWGNGRQPRVLRLGSLTSWRLFPISTQPPPLSPPSSAGTNVPVSVQPSVTLQG